jgi:hypothetical protein
MSIFQPLTNIDILNRVKKYINGVQFIPYSNLKNITNIEQLLPATIILYQNDGDVGHFVCIFLNTEGIQYFDPLGYFPDWYLGKVDNITRIKMNENFTYMINLLLNSKYKVNYNATRLESKDTSMCGHFVGVRLALHNLTCDEFIKIFKTKNKTKYYNDYKALKMFFKL